MAQGTDTAARVRGFVTQLSLLAVRFLTYKMGMIIVHTYYYRQCLVHSRWYISYILSYNMVTSWKPVHRYPPLFKSLRYTYCFYKRPMLVPVFTNQKKSREDFRSCKKKSKSTHSIQHLFCSEPLAQGGPTRLLPRNHTQRLSIRTVCVSVCALSQFILCNY